MTSVISIVEYPSVVTVEQVSTLTVNETVSQIDIGETNSNVSINQTNILQITETPANVTIEQNSVELVQVGVMGPQGIPGEDATVSDEAIRTDDVNGTVLYKGWAVIGTENSDAVWKIARYTFTGDDLVVEWADGNNNYDNVWDNRLALSYD